MICLDCGAVLSDEERHYYEVRCEGCEREHFDRIGRWRAGGADEDLDRLYDGPQPVRH